ncbi:endolysin [Streptomyces sp. NBC_01549]|uniref:endolysin n=1 Tax=Streptomyces sp. NBC_01549 TaxID=2975874 RepID=UPI00224D3053|nr:endolysin [Streptomyces sp. NBC_01549]MCX4596074.1 endolysin [Streptomyces sp. NBC_01549]
MVDLWMPGAARHALGNEGAMNGGPARAVWHITSNATDWTFARELGWFTGGGADVAPHLLWDPWTGEIAQFFPADSRSLSLQNAGDVRTNRTGKYCVQIEIVFTANETVGGKRYATVRDTPCKGLDGIMTWLRSLGIPDVWPGGAPTGFVRDTVSLDAWTKLGGHYGHNQIPANSHVDPGPMPDLFAHAPVTPPKPPTPAKPKVSLAHVIYAAKHDPAAAQGHTSYKGEVLLVEKALHAEGLLDGQYVDGSFGSKSVDAYKAWQRHLGYSGSGADGIPGQTSLAKLGAKHGFQVIT